MEIPGPSARRRMLISALSVVAAAPQGNRWTRAVLSTDAGWARPRHLARAVLVAEGESDPPLPEICIVR
ncbi:hypothetical protein [Streptomyces flavotricini]|uniref:hypothetical protein n=1 Tax=Streptomyces flavotricini TaxID=66888 RepID=UPI001E2EC15C|nr:hypothetical protein [Streptomyces flavotricini]